MTKLGLSEVIGLAPRSYKLVNDRAGPQTQTSSFQTVALSTAPKSLLE